VRALLRPTVLALLTCALVLGGIAWYYLRPPADTGPKPLPVADGEEEIVWLEPGTNAATWEQFVAAVQRAAERLNDRYPGIHADIENDPSPEQAAAVPQVSLTWPNGGPRLVFRWYKITSDWRTREWISALLRRPRPPLAVVGGSSSWRASELAHQLNSQGAQLPAEQRPILLITQATADHFFDKERQNRDRREDEGEYTDADPRLIDIYKGRTFRFCFTNRQMAAAISQFIWSRPDLRPDADPYYAVKWDDDFYSRDLIDGFRLAMNELGYANWWRFRLEDYNRTYVIASSVGTYQVPNSSEEEALRDLLGQLNARAGLGQRQPLLVVCGQTVPSRRFLRDLAQRDPQLARRCVVVTGDALAFNTLYRDRETGWPIPELPYRLICFCHQNPIDASAGFREQPNVRPAYDSVDPRGVRASGTDDKLLYTDIVEQVTDAALRSGRSGRVNAEELRQRLAAAEVDGQALFDGDGNRRPGTSEHLVYLRPTLGARDEQGHELPEALLEVWAARPEGRSMQWAQRGPVLKVYHAFRPE
jgi:hypothetical protein